MTDRMEKVSKTIKRHISAILQEETSDPRIAYITLTKVEVTRDLRLAKVFYTVLDETVDKKDVLKRLKAAASFVRTQLARRVSMKFIPKVSFREDVKKEKDHSIDEILEAIKKDRRGGTE